MGHFFKKWQVILGILLWGLIGSRPSWAQLEGQNWYMGNQAGVSFASGFPVALTNGQMTSYEGCATLSSPNGQLIAYTNGENVWDRSHQVMPNGSSGLGGHNSTSQTALLLPAPNNQQLVYLFCIDAIDNNLVGGLRYSLIDLNAHGGLGDVTTTKGIVLPTPTVGGKVTEKLTAVRHANGRDYWIVVHGWQSNAFYSFLLSPSGISTVPVVSNIGSVHQGGGSFFNAGNAIGCMKASPDGRHLALAQRDNLSELFDFNNATGGVSNYVSLGAWSYNYGVEFSPDNSRLYISLVLDGQLMQFNLLAGSPAAIRASAQLVGTGARSGTLQLGPNNKLYIATYNNLYMDVVNNPNALGTACGYQANAVSLGGKLGQNGLPNMPNAFGVNDIVSATATFTSTATCAGSPVAFVGTTTPFLSGAVATWNFGDPASGSANTATGLAPTHSYAAAGTYQVTLTVTHPSLATPAISTQSVTVYPLPTPRLPADTTVCTASALLRLGPQPAGSTYRWQDGSTGTTFLASASGTYSVQVTTPQGCVATATSRVQLGTAPVVRLAADTLVCPTAVWTLRLNPQPAGTSYRWQDGSTGATYVARGPGQYAVEVRAPVTGCATTATLRAGTANCPIVIPNVITPNGDPQNEFFTLKGLQPSDWHISIFDRWGRQVYDRAQYDNSWNAAGQSAGLYYYRLHNAATGERHQGWVEVVRGS